VVDESYEQALGAKLGRHGQYPAGDPLWPLLHEDPARRARLARWVVDAVRTSPKVWRLALSLRHTDDSTVQLRLGGVLLAEIPTRSLLYGDDG
jgi:hypothetical protein